MASKSKPAPVESLIQLPEGQLDPNTGFPVKISISSVEYTVNYRIHDSQYWDMDGHNATITIDSENSPERQKRALMQAIMFAIDFESGIRAFESKAITGTLKYIFPAIIKNNPGLYLAVQSLGAYLPVEIDIISSVFKISSRTMDGRHGHCDFEKNEIVLHVDDSGVRKAKTLCHEIWHGLLYEVGAFAEFADEKYVQALEQATYSFLLNNNLLWFYGLTNLKEFGITNVPNKSAQAAKKSSAVDNIRPIRRSNIPA